MPVLRSPSMPSYAGQLVHYFILPRDWAVWAILSTRSRGPRLPSVFFPSSLCAPFRSDILFFPSRTPTYMTFPSRGDGRRQYFILSPPSLKVSSRATRRCRFLKHQQVSTSRLKKTASCLFIARDGKSENDFAPLSYARAPTSAPSFSSCFLLPLICAASSPPPPPARRASARNQVSPHPCSPLGLCHSPHPLPLQGLNEILLPLHSLHTKPPSQRQ